MGKYLRIKNRGECPRIYLTLLGASTKSDKMEDPTQGGWFGSGTKYAPIAALYLGIEVAIASRDDQGKYFIQYVAEKAKLPGRKIKYLVRVVTSDDGKKVRHQTDYAIDACQNWRKPIGDDEMKSFRVLREYLRNAYDADAEFAFERCDTLEWPPDGWTYVYLTMTDEFRRMLAVPARYFKWVSPALNPPPRARFANGSIYARSDAACTRLFSLGTLAFCSDEERFRALFDYDIDVKQGHQGRPMLSEERTFAEISLVFLEVKKMLSAWTDVRVLTGLLKAMMNDAARFEVEALGYGQNDDASVPAKAAWREAWRAAYGADAVISSNAYADELARYTFGKTAIVVQDRSLRNFLKACGVPEATQCIPGMVAGQEYRLVADLEEWERVRLETALSIMRDEYPESAQFQAFVFEPLTDRMRKTLGFTAYDPLPVRLFVQRACLRSWNTLIETLTVHECRHGRTKMDDSNRGFTDRADRDIAKMLLEKYGLPTEPAVETDDIALPSVIVPVAKP